MLYHLRKVRTDVVIGRAENVEAERRFVSAAPGRAAALGVTAEPAIDALLAGGQPRGSSHTSALPTMAAIKAILINQRIGETMMFKSICPIPVPAYPWQITTILTMKEIERNSEAKKPLTTGIGNSKKAHPSCRVTHPALIEPGFVVTDVTPVPCSVMSSLLLGKQNNE